MWEPEIYYFPGSAEHWCPPVGGKHTICPGSGQIRFLGASII